MGGPSNTPKLLGVFTLVICFLVLNSYQISADSEVDADLVFDSLEVTKSNHQRISRDASNSSPPVEEEHWLTSTVNRIKRSIGDIFTRENKKLEKTNHPLHKKTHVHHAKGTHPKKAGSESSRRKHRQAQDEYDEGQEDYDEEPENEGGQTEYVDPDEEYEEYEGVDEAEEDLQNGENNLVDGGANDDEDLYAPSGDHGSGEPDREFETTTKDVFGHPHIYRFAFTVSEPYRQEYEDRNSPQFQELSSRIKRAIQSVFVNVPGQQFVSVVKYETTADSFQTRVTVDIDSQGYADKDVIKRALFEPIQKYHRIDNVITAGPEDLRFTEFEATGNECDVLQMRCNNGICISAEFRCDGINDCSDNSDEEGCPARGPIVEPEIPGVRVISTTAVPFETTEQTTQFPTTIPTTTTTTTTTTTPAPITTPTTTTTERITTEESFETESPDFEGSGVGDCRADDSERCADGSRIICADQRCDGTPDCDDGSDERGCQECRIGEFRCDVSRCIPENQRCNGISECSDNTDEHNCVVECTDQQFRCDGDRCLSNQLRCNGVSDCQDNEDERDCEGR